MRREYSTATSQFSPFFTLGAGVVDAFKATDPDKEVAVKVALGALSDLATYGNGNKLQAKFQFGTAQVTRPAVFRPLRRPWPAAGIRWRGGCASAAPATRTASGRGSTAATPAPAASSAPSAAASRG